MLVPPETRTRTKEGKKKEMNWINDAACRGVSLGTFFLEKGKATERYPYQRAKNLCQQCPVQTDCLEYAMLIETDPTYGRHGVYGGLSPDERATLHRKRQQQVA
jgi:WhiB family redox-sensing transcriptional regulator